MRILIAHDGSTAAEATLRRPCLAWSRARLLDVEGRIVKIATAA